MAEPTGTKRNPTWSRDELILALDLYVRHGGNPRETAGSEVAQLSETLRMLAGRTNDAGDFRNANGIYMKAMNFRRFDPVYIESGRVGLQRGGKDEEYVWNTFAHDPGRLRAAAEAIQANATLATPVVASEDVASPEGLQEAEEGRLLTVQHVKRERSRKLVEAKKKAVVDAGGSLTCEACGFDFEATYGERGKGFIEVHHVQPLSSLRPGSRTKLSDLALVCANCHRMVHARSKWLTVDALRSMLIDSKNG